VSAASAQQLVSAPYGHKRSDIGHNAIRIDVIRGSDVTQGGVGTELGRQPENRIQLPTWSGWAESTQTLTS